MSDRRLKTRAVITPEYGVFLDETQIKTNDYSVDNSNPRCSNSEEMYSNALYKQFLSHVSQQYTLRNIPLIKDVVSDDDPYTMKEVYVHFYWTSSSKIKYDIGKFLSVRCDDRGYVYYSDLIFKLRQIYGPPCR